MGGIIFENGIMEFLYVSLLIFWIVYLYFVQDYGYWEHKDVPHVPAVFPFGSTIDIVLGRGFMGTVFDRIYKDFKDERYVGFINVRKPYLLIKDPELIKLILRKDFHYFTDHTIVDAHPKDYLMKHLFNRKGQEWKEMRKKMAPAYTAAKMKMMFFLVKTCSDLLQDNLEQTILKNNVVDIKYFLSQYVIEVIATCVLGIEIKSQSDDLSKFHKTGEKAFDLDFKRLLKLYMFSAFPIFRKLHCFDFFDYKTAAFLTKVIQSTVEFREKHNVNQCDFLGLMIKLRQNQSILEEGESPAELDELGKPGKSEGLTIEEITAESFLFFIAGYETTSNTILFCLYELACNSHIQDTLHNEVHRVLEGHDGNVSYQALEEMSYMDQVIKETMRCYPVFPTLWRNCTENYRIPNSDLVIEKDMKIVIPIYSLHHDAKYFPDPDTFDPERFKPQNCKERHPFVFLPFGEGPRMCIGFRFGLMQVKTALATLSLHYTFSLAPGTKSPLQIKSNSIVTLPSKPLKLVFYKRKDIH